MDKNKLISWLIMGGVVLGVSVGGYFLTMTPRENTHTNDAQSILTYQNQYFSVDYPSTWHEESSTSSSSVFLVSNTSSEDDSPFQGMIIRSYTPEEYIAYIDSTGTLFDKNAILQSIQNHDLQGFADSINYSCKLYLNTPICRNTYNAKIENINGTQGYILVSIRNSDPYGIHIVKGVFFNGGRLTEVTANIAEGAQHLENPAPTDSPIDIIKNTEFGKIIMSLRLK